MIQTFTVEVDTGIDDERGVTVDEIERLLLGYEIEPKADKVALGAYATVVVQEQV